MIAALREFFLPMYRLPSSLGVQRAESSAHHLDWSGVLKEAKGADERTSYIPQRGRGTPLIFASRAPASTPEPRYIKPGQAYFRTDDLALYFDGNPDAWFPD